MIGCEVYSNLFILFEVDENIYGDEVFMFICYQVVCFMYDYIEDEMSKGVNFWYIVCYMLGIF